jgi:hypothetical protein
LTAAEEAEVWAVAREWWVVGGSQSTGHFGGGIVTLKLLFPLLDRFNESAEGLRVLTLTDAEPSIGRWVSAPSVFENVTVPAATTLWEAYQPPDGWSSGENSLNHVMFAGPGAWIYETIGGCARDKASRSWSQLVVAPIRGDDAWAHVNAASVSQDTPMGLAAVSWVAELNGSAAYEINVTIPVNARARIVVAARVSAEKTTVREGGIIVWSAGVFVPGVEGIPSAVSGTDGMSVEFLNVGSGMYSFRSESTAAA